MNAIDSIAARAISARATALNVPSPCLSVCKMSRGTALCAGCFRTLDEIAAWGRMDDAGKRAVWGLIVQRAGAA
jgi:uncharacterized protein